MTPEQVILDGDKVLEKMAGIDDRLLKKVLEFISINIKDGKLQISDVDLANLEDMLYGEIKASDYPKNLENYLGLFQTMLKSVSLEQGRLNGLKVQEINNLWASAENNQDIISKIKYDLGRPGLEKVVIKGIADAVRDANYFNLDYNSAITKLKEFIKPTTADQRSWTQQYLDQFAKDALNQYDGAIQDRVRKVYEFKTMLYIGNSIETSRPFCLHLRDDLGGRMSEEQLRAALHEYCPNGEPSDSVVSITTPIENKKKKMKKGSGMILGTTFDNFSQMRGGYGCRHRVAWVK